MVALWYGDDSLLTYPFSNSQPLSAAVRGAPRYRARLVKTVLFQGRGGAPSGQRRLLRAPARSEAETRQLGSGIAVDWVPGLSY